MHQWRIENALQLIRAEYETFPGLSLTLPQVCRLFDLDAATAEALVGALVDSRFLQQRGDGCYIRRPQAEPSARPGGQAIQGQSQSVETSRGPQSRRSTSTANSA